MNDLKKKERNINIITILFCIGVLLIGFWIGQEVKSKNNTESVTEKLYKTLQDKVDSLKAVVAKDEHLREKMSAEIIILEQHRQNIIQSVESQKKQIQKIKSEYEKIPSYSHYNNDSILLYFSNEFK